MILFDSIEDCYQPDITVASPPTLNHPLLIINSVSGVGRTTLSGILVQKRELGRIKNFTTRPPRPGDDHKNYTFLTNNQYQSGVNNNQFFCSIHWHANDHFYGIENDAVSRLNTPGLYENTHFGWVLKKTYKNLVTNIWLFAKPETVRTRLIKRGTDPQDEIRTRISFALEEQQFILSHMDMYVANRMIDYYFWVDHLSAEQLAQQLISVLPSEFV